MELSVSKIEKFLIFPQKKAFLIFRETPKIFLIFQETELSYFSGKTSPKKLLIFQEGTSELKK